MKRALKVAFKIGILPKDFWAMTPYELRLCVEASNDRLVDERGRDLWTAWHTAYLHRVDKFPHLNELMPKILQHAGKAQDNAPDPKQVSRDLMNALLQFRTAPPPPKKTALDASDAPDSPSSVGFPPVNFSEVSDG